MTVDQFKKKWRRYQGKETSGYVEHFNDLCGLLGQQTPNEADPSGRDFFCFQKRVVKDAELFDAAAPDGEPNERGFADVWKKNCFGWEYKGKKKNLDEAYRQLLRYREDLENPPLLVVCDFDRYIIRTNFNGTVLGVDLRDPATGKLLYALPDEPSAIWWLAWSPDSQRLAVSRANGEIAVWNLREIETQLGQLGLNQ
jgi:WD40 repeat protein